MFDDIVSEIQEFEAHGQEGLEEDGVKESYSSNVVEPHLAAAKRLGLDLKGPQAAPTLAPGLGGNTSGSFSSSSKESE